MNYYCWSNKQEEQDKWRKNSRNFFKMSLFAIQFKDSSFIDCIRSVSKEIEVLEINCVNFKNQEIFYEFIACFPKLRKLLMDHSFICEFIDYGEVDQHVKELPTLKLQKLVLQHVKSFNGYVKLYKTLIELKIQSEEIFIDWRNFFIADGDVVELLTSQENLVTLGLRCHRTEFKESALKDFFGCLLNKMERVLTIRNLILIVILEYDEDELAKDTDASIVESMKNFIKFLDVVKNSLRCLEIRCPSLPTSVIAKIIDDLQLERLYIDAENFPGTLVIHQQNHHLKSLLLIRSMKNLFATQLFEAFPKIQYLALSLKGHRYDEVMKLNLISIAENLKSLKYLQIRSIPDDVPEIRIPSLLAIFNIFYRNLSIEGIRSLLNSNPTVQTLLLDDNLGLRMITNQDLEQLNMQCLKQLIIHQDKLSVRTEMLQMLSNNCPNLESFQVKTEEDKSNDHLKCGKVELRYFKKDVIETIFNQKTTFWQNEKEFSSDHWETFGYYFSDDFYRDWGADSNSSTYYSDYSSSDDDDYDMDGQDE